MLPSQDEDAGVGIPHILPAGCRASGFRPGQREASEPQEPQPRCRRRLENDGGKTDGRKEGGRPGAGTRPRLPADSERRLPAVAMAAATSGRPRNPPPRLLSDSDSRQAAAGDARPPTSGALGCKPSRCFRGCEQPGPTRKKRAAARQRGQPPAVRRRRARVARAVGMFTYLPAARPASAHIRRHSAASAATVAARGTNTKLPAAAATPLRSDGSYLGPSWVRLRSASLQP